MKWPDVNSGTQRPCRVQEFTSIAGVTLRLYRSSVKGCKNILSYSYPERADVLTSDIFKMGHCVRPKRFVTREFQQYCGTLLYYNTVAFIYSLFKYSHSDPSSLRVAITITIYKVRGQRTLKRYLAIRINKRLHSKCSLFFVMRRNNETATFYVSKAFAFI